MEKYSGMTVNERLAEAGLLDEFDSAVRDGNKEKIVALLMSVEIDLQSAVASVEQILSHPTRYGRL